MVSFYEMATNKYHQLINYKLYYSFQDWIRMNVFGILSIFVAFSVMSTSGSTFRIKKNRLERRHNDKYPTKFWSKGSKKSSPITYISIPSISNWFTTKDENAVQERSNPISNSITDDLLGKIFIRFLEIIFDAWIHPKVCWYTVSY